MNQQKQPVQQQNQIPYTYPQTYPVNYAYMPMPYYYQGGVAGAQNTAQTAQPQPSVEDVEKKFSGQLDELKKHIDEKIAKYQKEQFEAEKRAWEAYGRSRGFM